MPAKKQTTGTRKSTATKKTSGRQTSTRSRKPAKKQSTLPTPAIGILLIAIGVVFFFSVIAPTNATLIVAIRQFVNGTFGKVGIFVSIWIAYAGLQVLFGDRWPVKKVVLLQSALLLFCIATLLQVFRVDDLMRMLRAEGYVQDYNAFMWKSYDASKNVTVGGGSMGGLLGYPMKQYLDVVGSALVLFFSIFGLGFWLVRTLMPTAGEQMGGWFGQLWDNHLVRREERAAEKEAYQQAQAEYQASQAAQVNNDALLVEIPPELLEMPPQDGKGKAVAKGRKQAKPARENAPVEVVPPAYQQPAYAPKMQQQQVEMDWNAQYQPQPVQEIPQPGQAKPQPQPQETPPARTRPAKRSNRLYIENDTAPRNVSVAEEAYTEYDAERFKYANRPSRKDPDAVPEFIIKRRAQYDAEYGRIDGGEAPMPGSQAPEAQDAYDESMLEAPVEAPDYDTYANVMPEMADETYQEEPPVYPTRRQAGHTTSPIDMVPELDPETRLDRADWKAPEPEVITAEIEPDAPEYRQPPFSLLVQDKNHVLKDTREEDAIGSQKLEETLASFGVTAHVTRVVHGPAITRYELQPAPGIKVSKIVGLTDDIALNMAAVGVRIEAPIPGKAAIGIELANDEIQTVYLRDVLESGESVKNPSKLAVALGKDIAGKPVIADLARMPHLLIAGATGSGKSVCINTLITSIIYRATPEEVRLILIDPKKVELGVYNGIPHLLVPVVTEPKKASGALAWAVMEMDQRYKLFAEKGVRNIKGYNDQRDADTPLMPQIVVIIDELSDLMMVAPGEVEESIVRITQLARACGIHLVIATQRPSVNVITGIIKANVPSRIAFAVASQVDSRTILDSVGAEKLLGRGDMLYAPSGGGKPLRVQGCFVSDDEVTRVVEYVKDCHETDYSQAVIQALEAVDEPAPGAAEEANEGEHDALFEQAVEMAIESGQASISMLQRRLRVGYARAGRIVDEMAQSGIIGQADGAKPREVLMTREEFNRTFRAGQEPLPEVIEEDDTEA